MDAKALILQNVANHISLTKQEAEIFLSFLKPVTIRKKEFLEKSGTVCRHSAFVAKGCLKGFTVDKNAVEHVLSFAPQNWWIADMYSLISQKPGVLSIQAIDDAELLLLSKSDQELIYERLPQFERFFRILTENSLVANQQRLLDNLSLTAEERYENFGKKFPGLLQTVPLKDLASYIGVTPAFFSRMRNQSLRKKLA